MRYIVKAVITVLLSSSLLNTGCNFIMAQQGDFDGMVKNITRGDIPFIYDDQLTQLINEKEEIILLDTRPNEEYNVSHLPGARCVGYDDFEREQVDQIDRNTTLVVYCSVGYRSERIGRELKEMGFKEVYNLYGGIFKWKNEGNTVVNQSGETDSVHTYNKKWSKWLYKGTKVYD